MGLKASLFLKNAPQGLAFITFVFSAPAAFSDSLLKLTAPEETLSAPQATLIKAKPLLKLPAPHRDLSVYDEAPAHYGKRAADSLVISPVTPSLPTPDDSDLVSQKAVKIAVKKKKPRKKAKVNTVDDQDDKADNSSFSLQHEAGLGPDSRVQINGFLTAGALGTNNGAYYQIPGYGNVRNDYNFAAASRIGLQVTGNILHNVAVVGQFVADGDDTQGHRTFNVTADWAYIRYNPRPEIQLRAGRFRLPTLFYSENAEVGYTYPWIVLPNEVYGILPITNLNGVSSIGSMALGQSNWTLRSQTFFGSASNRAAIYNTYNPNFLSGSFVNYTQNDVYGSSLSIGNPYFELRGLYMSFETTAQAPVLNLFCPNGTRQALCTLANNVNSSFYSLGAKVDIDHFLLLGEYAHRQIAALITSIDSYYVMAAYQFRGFMPNLTYSSASTTNPRTLINTLGQFPIDQDTWTLGLNYTINSNLMAKMSLSAIQPLDGTFGFFNTNPGRNRTIMMYGASLDAIF